MGKRCGAQMKRTGRITAEFVLIVAGILAALAIDSAVEDRHDDRLREEYLARVQVDLETDKQAIQHRMEFFTDVREFCRLFLNWLESERPLDQEVLLASFHAAEIWPWEPSASTYQDLINTGNIRLFQSLDFRHDLVVYYMRAAASLPHISVSEDYRKIIRGTIPNDIQSQIFAQCPTADDRGTVPTDFPPCELENIDYEQLTAQFQQLREDEVFKRALIYRISELRVKNYLLAAQSGYADDVLMQLVGQ